VNLKSLFLFLHIMSAICLVGGLLSRQIVRAHAKKMADVRVISELYNAAGRIESVLIIPFNMMVVVSGLIYAIMIKAPILGFLQGASQNWLLVTNLLVLATPLPIIFFFIPRGRKFEPVMREALGRGQITPELAAQLQDPMMKRMHLIELIGVVFVVALMVFKPF